MIVAQLTSSPFFGGPERQMFGLARHLPAGYESKFLLFQEGGRHRAFLDQVRSHGFEAIELSENTPRFLKMAREVAERLRSLKADVLCCNGYKADLVGLPAARLARIPVVAISHGWTAATGKVRIYDALDRASLYWMDRVICVSEAQAAKVRATGVPPRRVSVIRNAISLDEFENSDPDYHDKLRACFPTPPRFIVGTAGRFSPEKGIGVLIRAAAIVRAQDPRVGFVIFGDGPLRASLEREVARLGLRNHVILAGFRSDVRKFLPHFDLTVLPSYTEGLPVIALESLAAGVAVVATAVGGTPEVIESGVNGDLVPPGDPTSLARGVLRLLHREEERKNMGSRGRDRVQRLFSFDAHSIQYQNLFSAIRN